jgi:hypothetical protein
MIVMRYVARVIVVFPEGTSYPNTLDAWDTTAVLEAIGARNAVQRATSMSRSVFEDPGNLKILGYSTKPILYVVSSISTAHHLRGTMKSDRGSGIVITDMMSLTKRDVQMLRTRHQVSVPLHALYVVEP